MVSIRAPDFTAPPTVGACCRLAALCLVSTGWLAHAEALSDPLIDIRPVTPPRMEERKIQQPTMTWIISESAPDHCARVRHKDGHISRKESCVYWIVSESRCVMVTRAFTSHSELGHLTLACIRKDNS
jgi:hypothetical protein